jgi:hypothetical protein
MRIFTIYLIFIPSLIFSQTGPGGVGAADGTSTLRGWWRGDAGVTITSGAVSTWTDQSGYTNNLTQTTAGNRPTSTTSASLNGRNIIRYTGSSSQFFNSSFSGPNVDNMTLFLVANGTNYQSLFRFQNNGGAFTVYPWELGGGKTFVISSDGGTGGGLASGLVNSINNVGAARYRRNTVNGMQTFLNGGINVQRTSANSVLPNEPFYSGRYNPGASEYPTADVGEMILYYSAVNDAQMVIIQNYLAAKYNVTLASNDVYVQDNPGNGNYDFDVAGIGRTNSTNIHDDSRGTGLVRILNPTDLGDGEYFMWGHDNGTAQATNTTDIPAGIDGRFSRVWRISETGGDVGNIDVQVDVTGLVDFASLSVCDGAGAIRLLVDTNNDGLFADQTPIAGATNIGGNIFRFANVSALNNNLRFTFAIVSPSNGPGGVGNAATNFLFLRSDLGTSTTTNNTALATWSDQSGNSNNATQGTAGNRPTYLTSQLNGFPSIRFNGTTNFLAAPSVFPVNSDYTKFVIGKIANTSDHNNFFSGSSGHAMFMLIGSLAPKLYQGGTFVTSSISIPLNTFKVLSGTFITSSRVGEIFVDGTSGGTGTAGSTNSDNTMQVGAFGGVSKLAGDVTEVIGYNYRLNSAQRILVENYLAAKYGLTLTANDVYTRDNPANGNFDYDVAGIGRVDASNQHTNAKGTGIIRVSNPTNLGNSEYFMWGHDNGLLKGSTADVPTGIQVRTTRVWSVSESGDVGSVDIQFDLSSQGSVTASDLRLLVDHDGDGIFNEAGTVIISGAIAYSCGNYVFPGVSAINDGMRFTIGSVNLIQTPLPITLISFEGKMKKNNEITLTWATASELNNNFFVIERSTGSDEFMELATVTGAGTSNTRVDYESIDHNPAFGKNYYRLKQVDFDGKYSYSKIIALENNHSEPQVDVSPNPIASGGKIQFKVTQSTNVSKPQVSLYDLLGRSIPFYAESNANDWELQPATELPAGLYILKVAFPDFSKTISERIIISEH